MSFKTITGPHKSGSRDAVESSAGCSLLEQLTESAGVELDAAFSLIIKGLSAIGSDAPTGEAVPILGRSAKIPVTDAMEPNNCVPNAKGDASPQRWGAGRHAIAPADADSIPGDPSTSEAACTSNSSVLKPEPEALSPAELMFTAGCESGVAVRTPLRPANSPILGLIPERTMATVPGEIPMDITPAKALNIAPLTTFDGDRVIATSP